MNNQSKKKRGERIRLIRKQAGLSLQALAKELDIRYQSILQWENGDTSPSSDNIGKLAAKFGVHPTWIWTGQGPKHINEAEPSPPKIEKPSKEYEAGKYTAVEQEYIDKLTGILRGRNKQAVHAVKTILDLCYLHCR
ncbi:MAG: helix-turn-helix transcriptional regulator [Desulfobacterales bacterium]|nr:helix-turn-helix transcriptional regulator [Desulfobacterales bacterium]